MKDTKSSDSDQQRDSVPPHFPTHANPFVRKDLSKDRADELGPRTREDTAESEFGEAHCGLTAVSCGILGYLCSLSVECM